MNKRALQAAATKKRIIKSSKKLILKKGYDNVSVDELSKAADITVGTFYYYFGSKFDLLLELLPKVDDYFSSETYLKLAEGPSYKKVASYFSYFATEIEKTTEPKILQIVYQSPQALQQLDVDRVMPGIELIVEAQVKNEITKDCSATQIAQIIFSTTRGICQYWSTHYSQDFPLSRSVQSAVDRLVFSYLVDNEKEIKGFRSSIGRGK